MLNIGGELAFILQDIDYASNRAIREDLKNYDEEQKKIIKPILAVSIQQAFYSSNWELMNYKSFCDFRRRCNGQSQSAN